MVVMSRAQQKRFGWNDHRFGSHQLHGKLRALFQVKSPPLLLTHVQHA